MKRLTKIQIIDETVEYYSKNSRAIVDGSCQYLTDYGTMCAHSRCLTDEGRKKVLHRDNTGAAFETIEELGDDIHKEEYRGHDGGFWDEIQHIHDGQHNWVKNELSITGKGYVNSLKKRYE